MSDTENERDRLRSLMESERALEALQAAERENERVLESALKAARIEQQSATLAARLRAEKASMRQERDAALAQAEKAERERDELERAGWRELEETRAKVAELTEKGYTAAKLLLEANEATHKAEREGERLAEEATRLLVDLTKSQEETREAERERDEARAETAAVNDRVSTILDEAVSMMPVMPAQEALTLLEEHVHSLRMAVEIAQRREPTQAEGDAHEYRHDQSMGASHHTGECFVPAGGWTGRRCIDCNCWVWGGPTRCVPCVLRRERDEAKTIASNIAASWVAEAEKAHAEAAELRAEVERLRGQHACWHCKVCLEPEPRPRCERCPDECDIEDCDAEGCVEVRAREALKGAKTE